MCLQNVGYILRSEPSIPAWQKIHGSSRVENGDHILSWIQAKLFWQDCFNFPAHFSRWSTLNEEPNLKMMQKGWRVDERIGRAELSCLVQPLLWALPSFPFFFCKTTFYVVDARFFTPPQLWESLKQLEAFKLTKPQTIPPQKLMPLYCVDW